MKNQTIDPNAIDPNDNAIDPNEVFPQVEKMLYSLAWQTSQKHPVTFEEAKSEAYFAFMRACTEYNKSKSKGGKFSSWCYFRTWTHLKTWITRRTTDRLTFVGTHEEEFFRGGHSDSWNYRDRWIDHIHTHRRNLNSPTAPPTVSSHTEFIEDLSDDAREIISMLVETPGELIGVGFLTPKRFMKKVKECLVKRGRNRQQVNRAHEELKLRFSEAWA